MKKNNLMTVLMAATVAAGLLTGCGSNAADTTADATATDTATDEATDAATDAATDEAADAAATDTNADLSGSIAMAGSTAGIESLEGGSVDIGNSSRSLKDEEKAAGCVENIVAIDGIAVVLDPANTVTDLTQDQLVQIYKGEVTNWKDLGGSDEPIVVVGREAGSGTRGAFEELLGLEDACQYANELDSTGAVIAKVASTPGAIGYASLDAVDDTIIAAKLNGVEPTEENIKAGSYILSRPFVMATMGEVSAQSEPVQALFDYLKSDEGKQLIQSVGLITVD